MKKITTFILAIAMVITANGVFAACGRNNKDIITLTVYSQLANHTDEQLGFSKTLLEDKFGVRLNIVAGDTDTYDNLVNTGSLGDLVIWGNNGSQYQKAIALDLLRPWDDEMKLLDNYGTNLKKYFPKALEANRALNKKIGPESIYDHVYGIGHSVSPSGSDSVATVSSHESFFYSWDIRWDLYKQLGYPEVNTLDDYISVFEQMKEINPTDDMGAPTYAFSLFPDWDGNMVMNVKSFASAYYGYDEFELGLYDAVNGVFHGALEEDGPYIEALRFFNKLNQKKLIDPDSMTQNWDKMAAKVANGGVFASTFDFSGSNLYNTEEHLAAGKAMMSLVPTSANTICYGLNESGGERVWSIGSRSAYPELCMQIIDWCASPEGAMTIWYGLQGVHWDYDAEGNTYFTEFGKTCWQNPNEMQTGHTWTSPYTGKTYDLTGTFDDGKLQINNIIWSQDAVNPDSNGERFKNDYWHSEMERELSEIENDWSVKTSSFDMQEYMEKQNYSVIPASSYIAPERSASLDVKWTNVVKTLKEYTWNALRA
ncbi:MAG: hypothetical protein J6Z34_05575, partial [Clostridia bacterium]|nr:hypothetical protein [Clostridia bacterium]